MRIQSLTSCFTLATSLFCASAIAQSRYCIGGDLDHLSSAQRSTCNARLGEVRELATAMHAPADWHFVVVCGEQGWEDYVNFNGGERATALLQASFDTQIEQHETYLRESRLGHSASDVKVALGQQIAEIVQQLNSRQAHNTAPLTIGPDKLRGGI